jgi:hypothetical protein
VDSDLYLGLFIMFGLPLIAILSNYSEPVALGWKAFRYAGILFFLFLLCGGLLHLAGVLPAPVNDWVVGFWPRHKSP